MTADGGLITRAGKAHNTGRGLTPAGEPMTADGKLITWAGNSLLGRERLMTADGGFLCASLFVFSLLFGFLLLLLLLFFFWGGERGENAAENSHKKLLVLEGSCSFFCLLGHLLGHCPRHHTADYVPNDDPPHSSIRFVQCRQSPQPDAIGTSPQTN